MSPSWRIRSVVSSRLYEIQALLVHDLGDEPANQIT
jgi:hypothetical protein